MHKLKYSERLREKAVEEHSAATAPPPPRLRILNSESKARPFGIKRYLPDNTSINPDGKLFAILRGSPECLIADAKSGKVLSNLKGHLDYSFTSAWHPSGQILATETRNNLLIVVYKVPIGVLRCTQRKDGCNQGHKILIRWSIYGYD
ncbi:Compass-like h3k4 histone methylase component wdr5a [Abeliophyllum distichum]|uniref:Compass-like h3k4 histone methylase component wdr5a n=1 Tax=Abeliophyllum distichum TaxID=126358 RepID=A0ABD1U015_9LAMI